MSNNGYEFALTLLAATVALTINGAGRTSLDAVLARTGGTHADRARLPGPRPKANENAAKLLIAAGAAVDALPATVLEGGITHGMLAMDSFLFGQDISQELRATPESPNG